MQAAHTMKVDVDSGVTLYVSLNLDPRKPAIVLSNSIAADLRMWDGQLQELCKHASVIRYDQRGHGQSSTPEAAFTVKELGTDVVRLLDHLKIERAIFCGLSLGGLTGMWLGIHHPERLDGLVLVNTAYSFPNDVWVERGAQARAHGMQPLVEATLKRWFTEDFTRRKPEEIARVREMILGTNALGYAACGDALRTADIVADLGRIRCPVRVIAGRYDPATPPARSEEIVRVVPGAELVTLEAAHVSPIEAAKPFGVLLTDFVGRHGRSPQATGAALRWAGPPRPQPS
jgi:3-oxoadipate enol-lactonase